MVLKYKNGFRSSRKQTTEQNYPGRREMESKMKDFCLKSVCGSDTQILFLMFGEFMKRFPQEKYSGHLISSYKQRFSKNQESWCLSGLQKPSIRTGIREKPESFHPKLLLPPSGPERNCSPLSLHSMNFAAEFGEKWVSKHTCVLKLVQKCHQNRSLQQKTEEFLWPNPTGPAGFSAVQTFLNSFNHFGITFKIKLPLIYCFRANTFKCFPPNPGQLVLFSPRSFPVSLW